MTKHTTENLEISYDLDESHEEKFFFNKLPKKSHEHENVALCKPLLSLYYTLTIL